VEEGRWYEENGDNGNGQRTRKKVGRWIKKMETRKEAQRRTQGRRNESEGRSKSGGTILEHTGIK
jgi:hypothetical protein